MNETTNPAGERYGLQQETRDPGPVGAESDAATPPGTIPAGAEPAQAQPSTWTMVRELIETVVLSLIIFLTVFIVMLVWVLRLDRRTLSTYANLPLDDDHASTPDARPDALRGVQL